MYLKRGNFPQSISHWSKWSQVPLLWIWQGKKKLRGSRAWGGGKKDCHNSADAKNKKNNGNRYRSETFFWSFIKSILFSHLSLSSERMCQVNQKKKKKVTRNLDFHSTFPEKCADCLSCAWGQPCSFQNDSGSINSPWTKLPGIWEGFEFLVQGRGDMQLLSTNPSVGSFHIWPMTLLPKWELSNSGNWSLSRKHSHFSSVSCVGEEIQHCDAFTICEFQNNF